MSENSIPTPLDDLHNEWGGKMTGFAGYRLPLSYAGGGFIAEHLHTRQGASLFDVSHMGQARILGDGAARELFRLTPADIAKIPEGMAKYALLTNAGGGVLDDFIVANDGARGLFAVFNASRKEEDFAHLRANLPSSVQMEELAGWGLIALQGPRAEAAAAAVVPAVADLGFMNAMWFDFAGVECRAARCGYTGEDGFEFSLPAEVAADFARKLAAHPDVKPAGLGARDSLRLEAGLCLYGNELNENITPVQAGLTWAIPKHRREGGDYPGAQKIAAEIRDKPEMRLVGLISEGRKVARAGAELLESADGRIVGKVSSGVFSPSLQKAIALGFVRADYAAPGTEVFARVRGEHIAYRTAKPPFVPHQYKKGE
ncbi:MAG: glycine cleavage system aminomethyltransferase GcvT [Gammaproteobacteria bacterium]